MLVVTWACPQCMLGPDRVIAAIDREHGVWRCRRVDKRPEDTRPDREHELPAEWLGVCRRPPPAEVHAG